eukprot:6178757-Pleurochrysis_carterae.AAC.2
MSHWRYACPCNYLHILIPIFSVDNYMSRLHCIVLQMPKNALYIVLLRADTASCTVDFYRLYLWRIRRRVRCSACRNAQRGHSMPDKLNLHVKGSAKVAVTTRGTAARRYLNVPSASYECNQSV